VIFQDRADAGRHLAALLAKYQSQQGVVYALPRGGVMVAIEVSDHLGWPLDLVIARKIGHPQQPEYAIAAVTGDGEIAVNQHEVDRVDPKWFERAAQAQREEAQRRHRAYLGTRPSPAIHGKVAIVIDDGIATGLTVRAALMTLRTRQPGRLILAVPVVPAEVASELSGLVDEIVAVEIPEFFRGSVGNYYRDFHQVSDDEVLAALAGSRPLAGA
jgi:predicted phosphoribosyltransferase